MKSAFYLLLCASFLWLAGCGNGDTIERPEAAEMLTTVAPTPPIKQTSTPRPTPVTHDLNLPQTAGIHELKEQGYTYSLYLPPDYDPAQSYPLVVSLHYAGYNGPYYGQDLLKFAMIPGFEALNPIIVAPDSQSWVSEEGDAAAMIVTHLILAHYPIDRERVVVAGYSMGGGGTWFLAGRYQQEIFTGAVPMAALPLRDSAEIDWQIPILMLNATEDELFLYEEASVQADALVGAGAVINFVPVDGVTHYEVQRFTQPLKQSVNWLIDQWEK